MKDVKAICVDWSDVAVECPHCGEHNRGFFSDPRTGEYNCESCGEDFYIPDDVEIVFE